LQHHNYLHLNKVADARGTVPAHRGGTLRGTTFWRYTDSQWPLVTIDKHIYMHKVACQPMSTSHMSV
jgi:hypothetical protein